ncbi:MAG TPA: hypothetical protein VF508_01365 [Pyrinomonadaceae bacterium]
MTTRASGTFEVRLSPQVDGAEGGAGIGRMLIDKRFAGDVYTQATNIEDERNGLIDAETGGLMVPPGILSSREGRDG